MFNKYRTKGKRNIVLEICVKSNVESEKKQILKEIRRTVKRLNASKKEFGYEIEFKNA